MFEGIYLSKDISAEGFMIADEIDKARPQQIRRLLYVQLIQHEYFTLHLPCFYQAILSYFLSHCVAVAVSTKVLPGVKPQKFTTGTS